MVLQSIWWDFFLIYLLSSGNGGSIHSWILPWNNSKDGPLIQSKPDFFPVESESPTNYSENEHTVIALWEHPISQYLFLQSMSARMLARKQVWCQLLHKGSPPPIFFLANCYHIITILQLQWSTFPVMVHLQIWAFFSSLLERTYDWHLTSCMFFSMTFPLKYYASGK